MTQPATFHRPLNVKLATKVEAIPQDYRSDLPLRAKSVCLVERPRSQYGRPVKSADLSSRLRYNSKLVFQTRRPQSVTTMAKKRRSIFNNVMVKQQNRKTVEKVPCTVSVQNLSLPMKYADNPKPRLSTSKQPPVLCNDEYLDPYKTKSSNPLKQVSENKKLCQTLAGEKGTENKLLLQISEAEQVADFERILNSNAILCERARRNVWRSVAANAPSATLVPRPRSSYSLRTVSEAYHHLHQQHQESLQPLLERYRRAAADAPLCPPQSLLTRNWYEHLHDLSEFYEDDHSLKEEIETINDRLITEEVKAVQESPQSKNFNVNLAGLIGLHVTGESFSPISPNYEQEVEKSDVEEEKEWLPSSMSADDKPSRESSASVDDLAQNFNSVSIDVDEKVPKITFSNCSEACPRTEQPNNTDVVIHLAVPTIESDESRPPIGM